MKTCMCGYYACECIVYVLCMCYACTVGVKSMSPVDIELLFVISYITALRLNIDIFSMKIKYFKQVTT